jgi:hypothetical protein
MKRLRENLPEEHAMAWMDFAENFTCSALEEVQSAYWNADMVTLHTSVIYFLSSHTKTHVSVVGVAETLSHNANTVLSLNSKYVIPKRINVLHESFSSNHLAPPELSILRHFFPLKCHRYLFIAHCVHHIIWILA